MVTMTRKTHGGSRDNLPGKTPTAAEMNRCSVEKQVNDHYQPTFVWCGDADKTVARTTVKMLAAALSAHDVPHKLIVYPGIDHGVGLGRGEKGVYLLCSLFYSAVRWDWRCPEISARSRRRFGTCKKWKSNP